MVLYYVMKSVLRNDESWLHNFGFGWVNQLL